MRDDRIKSGEIVALALGFFLGLLIPLIFVTEHWQGKVIEKKHAYYHPVTKEFTWVDEACQSCGKTN
jgi:hypothetical protein